MRKICILMLFALFTIICFPLQAQNILPRLQKLFGAENIVSVDSSAFNQYYKINFPQFIDHNDSTKGKFHNRILLGFNSDSAPMVMESAAYGITRKYQDIQYQNELTELLNANQLIIEHRYFGTSIPDSTTFKYLTYEQVSQDFHHILQKLNSLFPKKWIATGWSKGGDAVFAYRYYYPKDVDATVVYGISLTFEKEDHRFNKFMEEKRKTANGRRIYEDQLYLLKNKKRLLPAFIDYMQFIEENMGSDFLNYDKEIMFDYAVLDLQNTFWQKYGEYEEFTSEVELNFEALSEMGYDTKISKDKNRDKLIYILDAVFSKKMQAHYYQAFSEGGYYGYDEKPFIPYLKQKDYSLEFFAGEKTKFDNSFRMAQKKYAETIMENVMFILADTDPWSIVGPIPLPPGKDNLKLILKNSNHSVNLMDFDEKTRNQAIMKIKSWIAKN